MEVPEINNTVETPGKTVTVNLTKPIRMAAEAARRMAIELTTINKNLELLLKETPMITGIIDIILHLKVVGFQVAQLLCLLEVMTPIKPILEVPNSWELLDVEDHLCLLHVDNNFRLHVKDFLDLLELA